MSLDYLIRVEHLGKAYRIWKTPGARLTAPLQIRLAGLLPEKSVLGTWLRRRAEATYRDFNALQDVSLEIQRGESIGVIGRNGSGKSTLLQIIAGTLQATTGSVRVNGRIAALLELGSGFNPEFTGRENVYMNAAVLGLKRKEIEERFEAIAAFADIGDFLEDPVKTYSSGMFVRLAFAVATHVSADILLIDEALTVGDIFFQQKCYTRLTRLQESGVAIILVTHGLNDVEQFCSRAYLLHQGRVHAAGPAAEVVKRYYLVNQPPGPAGPDPQPPGLDVAATPTTTASSVPPAIESAWPQAAAFLAIAELPQVSENSARCTGIALCNVRGEPCQAFEQGESADFYYEFELLKAIDVPVVGLVLFNQKQIIVHGKNSLECGSTIGAHFRVGQRLRFRQRLKLDIAVGLYTFEIGLASLSQSDAQNAPLMNHAELNDRIRRHCHLTGLGPFEVTLRPNGRPVQLLHHGVADLPGTIEWLGALPPPASQA